MNVNFFNTFIYISCCSNSETHVRARGGRASICFAFPGRLASPTPRARAVFFQETSRGREGMSDGNLGHKALPIAENIISAARSAQQCRKPVIAQLVRAIGC